MQIFSSVSGKKAFTILEVMIAIFIFTLGLISIYALLLSSLQVNDYNKNAIIASQLARSDLEMIENIRDTNYERLYPWDFVSTSQNFSLGKFTILEDETDGSISLDPIPAFIEGKGNLSGMESYRICIVGNTYVPCSGTIDEKKTSFYKYVSFEEAKDDSDNSIPNAFLIRTKVIWNARGYHEFELKTILSDWRRI